MAGGWWLFAGHRPKLPSGVSRPRGGEGGAGRGEEGGGPWRGSGGVPGRHCSPRLQAHCGCTTSFLTGRTRVPEAPRRFPLAGRLPVTPAGLATPPNYPQTRSPPDPFHLYLRPLSGSPDLCPALPNEPQTAPGSRPPRRPLLVPAPSACRPAPVPALPRALAPARPSPALTPTAALQSQAVSEAAAETIHGPESARRPLPGPRRPRPPMLDLRRPTLSLSRGGSPRGKARGGAAHLPDSGPTLGAPGRACSALGPRQGG